MKNQIFSINGQSYNALIAGRKGAPLLLFLHGFPEYSGAWAEVLPKLAQDYFCVAPDQRGYGRSWRPWPVADYETHHLVSDVGAMIAQFGNGVAAGLIGHDWGASVAYAAAMRWPDRIKRLVIINGVHPAPFQASLASGGAQSVASQYITWLRGAGSQKALCKDDFAGLFALFGTTMDLSWLTPDRAKAYKAAWRDEAGLRAMINWYRASPIRVGVPGQPIPASDLAQWPVAQLRIRMAHLLIWGMGDTALLPEARAGLSDYCDDLRVVEIPEGDHWLIHQQPDNVAALIAGFMSEG